MNLLDKESQTILSRTPGFYTVPAPESLDNRYFDLADAIDQLRRDLADLRFNISDNPSPAQVEVINEAYSKFIKALPNKTAPKNKKVKS